MRLIAEYVAGTPEEWGECWPGTERLARSRWGYCAVDRSRREPADVVHVDAIDGPKTLATAKRRVEEALLEALETPVPGQPTREESRRRVLAGETW